MRTLVVLFSDVFAHQQTLIGQENGHGFFRPGQPLAWDCICTATDRGWPRLERNERSQSHADTGCPNCLLAWGHAFLWICSPAVAPIARLCRGVRGGTSAGAVGLGQTARYAMLAGMSALLFLGMTLTIIYGVRTFAKDLYAEMVVFALLISGICVLNAMKFMKILDGGLQALDMDSSFQMVFYIYMSSLATVIPPSIVWLVLRRLTDDLRDMAGRDPMTQLLNRRGLSEALQLFFSTRNAAPAHLLLMDVDHFKHINDTYGHQAGDTVLCHVAEVVRNTARHGDLTGRIGGEEFVVICLDTDSAGVMRLAERLRASIEQQVIKAADSDEPPLRCTVTIGVSHPFASTQALEAAMKDADAALYRGKAAGRNRIELPLCSPHFHPDSGAGKPIPLQHKAIN